MDKNSKILSFAGPTQYYNNTIYYWFLPITLLEIPDNRVENSLNTIGNSLNTIGNSRFHILYKNSLLLYL